MLSVKVSRLLQGREKKALTFLFFFFGELTQSLKSQNHFKVDYKRKLGAPKHNL